MDQAIIPECFVDTNLIETLVPPQSQYNHQKGCGTVTKVMKGKFADRFALGIIDKDKTAVDYLKEFELVCQKGNLLLHKHKDRPHYIIQIHPAIERFLLDCADATNVNLADFDLPTDLGLLKKESKSVNSKNDNRFKRLFKKIKDNNSVDFERLSKWISYLKANPYNANVEDIVAI